MVPYLGSKPPSPGRDEGRQAVADAGDGSTLPEAGTLRDETASTAPDQVGAYRVIGTLGRGGMGTVYLAEAAEKPYRSRVAIKVLKRGMDTDEVVRRFRAERQVLASLDHPNIVRLLDGGTTDDGLPYFVMEHVEGEPIDEYCRRRELPVQERLLLFAQVLPAVQLAHRNLVVHRDLKPSNILVTADGRPRLLDFGIAKVLAADVAGETAWQTAPAYRPMTPDYASPEQVRGERITTASDVYSLGVLLYELLARTRPFQFAGRSLEEIERLMRDAEPSPPSVAIGRRAGTWVPFAWSGREGPQRIRRQLQGDLDTIVMTAMHAESNRRYASVDALAEDIRRHLQGRPLLARPDTFTYRAEKFLRRHRRATAAAVTIAMALLTGLASTLWQASVARAQREVAERRFEDVRELARSYLYELHDAIAPLQGSTAARELMVRRGLEYLDRLATSAIAEPALQAELASAYARLGEVQWHRYYANLGHATGALESQKKAMAIRSALLADRPNDPARGLDVATSHVLMGDVLVATGALDEAVGHYRKALKLREQVGLLRPDDTAVRTAIAVAHQRLGDNLGNPGFPNLGDTEGSLRHYDAMQTIFLAAARATPSDARTRHSLSIGFEKIGDVRRAAGDFAGAGARYRESLVIRRQLSDEEPSNGRYRRDLAVAYGKVGLASELMEEFVAARAAYQEALAIRQRQTALDPSDAGARFDLATAYRQLASLDRREGRRAEADRNYRAALAIARSLSAADPGNAEFKAFARMISSRQ